MLDDARSGKEGKGVWLWTLASIPLLFVMEFVLFAALVPTEWARQASARELASLVATLGPESAEAIVARAGGWYDALFVRTGLQAGSYRLLIPPPDADGAGLAKLADSPFWPWLQGRLTVVWRLLAQGCRRLAALLAWGPFFAILGVAAWGDGRLRRRIRRYAFADGSPVAHRLALQGALWLVLGALLVLVAPIPLSALGVPAFGAVLLGLLGVGWANGRKRV
jgi:hypothetical protein